MKTRIISILLAVCLIFGLLPVGVLAANPTSGSCGANARWEYDAATKTLSISGSGDMTDYETDPVMGIENTPPWDAYREEIEHVIINEGITSIGAEAFGCEKSDKIYSNLSSASIAPTVKKIGDAAFEGAEKLKSIELQSVTSIGRRALAYTGLESIYIPASVEAITEDGTDFEWASCFRGCINLQSITVASGNPKYRSVDGVLFAENALLCYPAGKADASYVVPSGTTRIAGEAFRDNSNITAVSVPASVQKIGNYAFLFCDNLVNVDLAEGIREVASTAFAYPAVPTLVLPASVTDFTSDYYRTELVGTAQTLYFTGKTAPAFDTWGCTSNTIVYYPETATGWDDVQQQDNVKHYIEQGWLKFKTGTPPTEPSEPTDELKLVSTSPANDATDVTEDDSLVLTFNQELSKNLNWTKGSIYIKNYNTDETALKIDSARFYAFGGTVNGNSLTVPLVFSSLEAGKYYITMDAGVIVSSDGVMSFAGIQSKQTLSFETYKETQLYGCDFTMGRDSLMSNNNRFSCGDYYISGEDYLYLMNKLSIGYQLWVALKQRVIFSGEFEGNCYGASAVMGLLYTGALDLNDFDANAKNTFELERPVNNERLRSMLNYYFLLQFSPPFNSIDANDKRKTQIELSEKLLNALFHSNKPVVLNITFKGDGGSIAKHSVLAYAVDSSSDPDNYIILCADPNALFNQYEYVNKGISRALSPAEMRIDKKTMQVNEYTFYQPLYGAVEIREKGRYSNVKIMSVVDDLVLFENYVKETEDVSFVYDAGSFAVVQTDARNFTLSSNGKTAQITSEKIDGDLEVIGPIYDYAGNGNDVCSYYVPTVDMCTITYPSNNDFANTSIIFSGENNTFCAASTCAEKVTFSVDGSVSASGIAGASNLTTTYSGIGNTKAITVSTDSDNLEIVPTENRVHISSTSDLGNISVEGSSIWSKVLLSGNVDANSADVISKYDDKQGTVLELQNNDGNTVASARTNYRVCYISNGGSFVDAVTNIPYNTKLQQPESPTKTGYRFAGWYKDEALTQQWRFDRDVVTEDMELYAKWVKQGQTSGSNSTSSNAPQQNDTAKDVFTDVSKTDYFYDAVLWAVENGITTGTSRTRFSPYATCTRAQAVTFLWRASGSPTPKNSRMPFADVSPSAYYYDAVLWALEEDLTTGTSSTTFSPDAVIDRAQAVTFLHRANGAPSVTGRTAFTDVPQTAYYADAVKWAVDHGITTGTSATAFSPNASCTRAQIVTFLYRAYRG